MRRRRYRLARKVLDPFPVRTTIRTADAVRIPAIGEPIDDRNYRDAGYWRFSRAAVQYDRHSRSFDLMPILTIFTFSCQSLLCRTIHLPWDVLGRI